MIAFYGYRISLTFFEEKTWDSKVIMNLDFQSKTFSYQIEFD